MKNLYHLTSMLFVSFFLFYINGNSQNLETNIDKILNNTYKKNEPGASVLISKKGKVIYRKAFGKANLELDVSMSPENVFEIGSITKQFTAISILILLEQGQLNLEDEITKFLPDYPTKGRKITIHHLLTHTSGIKNYTSINGFLNMIRKDTSPLEMINFFKNEAIDFEPGSRNKYNNSGYIILGYIIEKISGLKYQDFIDQFIFKKANMSSSSYGSHTKLIANRASGYRNKGTYTNADYLSFTIPYAAGSIMSTVDDMLKWQQAINNNTLVKKETIARAFTNYTINNGTPINYGYGWEINDLNGIKSFEHGGGILGFTSMGIYVPSEDVYVILLTNCDCRSPKDLAIKIAALAIDKPYYELKDKVSLTSDELQRWVGSYQFRDGAIRHISRDGNQLFTQKEGRDKVEIYPSSNTTFYLENNLIQYIFSQKKGKKELVAKNRIQKFRGLEIVNAEVPHEKALILDGSTLKLYAGSYKLRPGLAIDITTEDDKMFAQPTSKPKIELLAGGKDSFTLKGVGARIIFGKDSKGNVTNLTLHQGERKMTGVKQ